MYECFKQFYIFGKTMLLQEYTLVNANYTFYYFETCYYATFLWDETKPIYDNYDEVNPRV